MRETATVPAGSYVRIGNTNALLFSSSQGLVYTPGPRLQTILGAGRNLGNPEEAVFTLTDISVAGGAPLTGTGGVFNSFDANASFSGNAGVVPAPGSVALLVLAGLENARANSSRDAESAGPPGGPPVLLIRICTGFEPTCPSTTVFK